MDRSVYLKKFIYKSVLEKGHFLAFILFDGILFLPGKTHFALEKKAYFFTFFFLEGGVFVLSFQGFAN